MSGERSLRSPQDLVAAGLAPESALPDLARVTARYALAVTPEMAALIDPDDPADPIARQFLPTPAELDQRPGERADPIGDTVHAPVEGIVHRYPDRVLLKLLHACPVYCRFCFRREVVGPGGAGMLSPEALAGALAYIRADAGKYPYYPYLQGVWLAPRKFVKGKLAHVISESRLHCIMS